MQDGSHSSRNKFPETGLIAAWGRWCRQLHWLQSYSDTNTRHHQHHQEVTIMIRAALLTLCCVLVCHAKEANIKFISGPEVITDLGKYPPSLCTLEYFEF